MLNLPFGLGVLPEMSTFTTGLGSCFGIHRRTRKSTVNISGVIDFAYGDVSGKKVMANGSIIGTDVSSMCILFFERSPISELAFPQTCRHFS